MKKETTKVSSEELDALINEAALYETFQRKADIKESFNSKDLVSYVPEGQRYEGYSTEAYTTGKGRYILLYTLETSKVDIKKTGVSGLIESTYHEYRDGHEVYNATDFNWEPNSEWNSLIQVERGLSSSRYTVKVYTSGYSNHDVSFVEKVATNLLAAVQKAKEVEKYLSGIGLLATDSKD